MRPVGQLRAPRIVAFELDTTLGLFAYGQVDTFGGLKSSLNSILDSYLDSGGHFQTSGSRAATLILGRSNGLP